MRRIKGFLYYDLELSGKALAETVLGKLINLGLDMRNCPGQGYDEAAAFSGHINRLYAHICRINSKAIYMHCHSHHLNMHQIFKKRGCLISFLLCGLKK